MRIHASILVRRPIAAVFAYLSTAEHLPAWLDGVAGAEGPALDEQDVGATLTLQRAACWDQPSRSRWEVIAYEPPRSLALRGLDHATTGAEVHWTLEGLPSGATRVRVDADLDTTSFFQPASADLAEFGTRQVQTELQALRRHLEAADGGG
jgi:uncharacterized protein YndB with AHSA1/START domain